MGKKQSEQPSESLLWPLLDKAGALRTEYRRRNSKFDQRRVRDELLSEALADGWQVHKKHKNVAVVRRDRKIDERLENLWWVLLYKMGYKDLNSGRQFRVKFTRKGVRGEKQIDVFASDDETVIITECKACDRLRHRSLQKDIEEFGALQGAIAASVKLFYGPDFRPKILWFFVTENVIWSDEDVARAEANHIRRVTENELPYYTQLADHLGGAARFQFLAEFLKNQRIPELSEKKVPATRGKLGGKYFYSFVTTPRHLLKIAFINHRTLDDPEGNPTYQRLIQKSRIKSVAKYIEGGGFFPNNLLINFVTKPRFDLIQKDPFADVHFGYLYLPDTYKSAWIIDGQHRLYGYAGLPDKFLDDKLVVVAFEGISKLEEANLFVTINHEQKPVPKNLLDDLEGQLKWESSDPGERLGAICARLIHNLNADLSSRLYGRFVAEGIRASAHACLTVPQVKIALRRSRMLGHVVMRTSYELGQLCGSTDSATLVRAQKVLNSYFRQVAEANFPRWEAGRPGRLCTNEGVQAFTLLLGELIRHVEKVTGANFLKMPESRIQESITPLLEPVLQRLGGDAAEVDQLLSVQYGSGGPQELVRRLEDIIQRQHQEFIPEGLEDWRTTQSEELKQAADQQVQQINSLVQKHIFAVFRKMYGEKGNAYWQKGVTSKDMKTKAYVKSLDDDSELPQETFLDFIDFKKIVEQRDHWPLFKSVMDISLNGTKGIAKNLDWMERVNTLRRISAHANEQRTYKPDDFDFLERVSGILFDRIDNFDYDSVKVADDA